MNQMVEGNSKMNENENEEETNNNVQCIHCKQEIIGKPWITVSNPDRDEYNISYKFIYFFFVLMCSKRW